MELISEKRDYCFKQKNTLEHKRYALRDYLNYMTHPFVSEENLPEDNELVKEIGKWGKYETILGCAVILYILLSATIIGIGIYFLFNIHPILIPILLVMEFGKPVKDFLTNMKKDLTSPDND